MDREKKWYIVYTYTGREIKTMYALKKKSIECFCPLNTTTVKERHKTAVMPLIPNYIFIHVSQDQLITVKRVSGVVNFMHWMNDYVLVEDEDIFLLKEITEKYQVLTAEPLKVNAIIPSAKTWEYEPVKSSNSVNKADFMKFSFPAYGFAVTAKEKELNVQVINFQANRSRQTAATLQYGR